MSLCADGWVCGGNISAYMCVVVRARVCERVAHTEVTDEITAGREQRNAKDGLAILGDGKLGAIW